jgi:choline dehydrogenase-like flavoprotein
MRDWAIGWDELRPYYEEAQELCGLGPFEYGAAHWSTATHTPFELDGTGLTSGVYQFGYADHVTRALADAARASEPISVAPSTTVVDLVMDQPARRVGAVRASDSSGRIIEIRPRVVILACGAVENARLLLLAGLGGRDGELLGRCFMEHARDFSLALVPHSKELFARAAFYDLHTSRDGALVGGYLGLADDELNAFALPNAAMTLIPRSRSRARRLGARMPHPISRVIGVASGDRYGWSEVTSPAKAFDRFDIVLNVEQRPRPQNRIELGTRTDRFGNALPHLSLRWTEEEQQDLERLRAVLRDRLRAANLGDLKATVGVRPDLSAHHHAGTTRMSLDPQDGVVDSDGRVFGIDNLYVAGASVFPTAGFANPTLTIVALARRLGRHLAKDGPVPFA